MTENRCACCNRNKGVKRGWTNELFCSEQCERSQVSRLHASMPGAGKLPRPGWVPYDLAREIERRWAE